MRCVDRQTNALLDQPTDQPTDKASYWCALSHLKRQLSLSQLSLLVSPQHPTTYCGINFGQIHEGGGGLKGDQQKEIGKTDKLTEWLRRLFLFAPWFFTLL